MRGRGLKAAETTTCSSSVRPPPPAGPMAAAAAAAWLAAAGGRCTPYSILCCLRRRASSRERCSISARRLYEACWLCAYLKVRVRVRVRGEGSGGEGGVLAVRVLRGARRALLGEDPLPLLEEGEGGDEVGHAGCQVVREARLEEGDVLC